MEEKEFLGKGIKFPVGVNHATGRFLMSQGAESVKESVYTILMTQRGERFVRPEFGCELLSCTFMETSDTKIHMMARMIRDAIEEQEPRVCKVEVEGEKKLDRGCVDFNVSYFVRETNTRDNLVFPFYLYNQEEEADEG